ncbi:heavy-metal-associated domain-containing protein [Anaeromyxobacter paludicola]|uniref:HMA domain-containing protein n=1 Tax=Anaeromyxobacter paludicola TaxID=2918171 RepID=A0ABN6NBR5_9BACT|nr:heavy-metal-associated domain-containing protein [Anaeromyxobacter paludicola]BDG09373.1 hypothetical protein AMPC_24860 [Anaeromyxobacter paludicola]
MKTLIVAAALAFLAPAAALACEECGMTHEGAHHEHAKAGAAATPSAAATPLAADEARVTIPITGMHCDHCVQRVKTALQGIEGVKRVDASLEKSQAVVAFQKEKVKPAKLAEAIDALGFKAGAPVQN